MLSSMEIRNVKFSKSVGGYKQEEVDIFLDKIEEDYEQYEHIISTLNSKIDGLEGKIRDYETSQSSIQNVLLSAQKLADQIVAEAKEKSGEIIKNAETSIETITVKEKELTDAFERKAEIRKAQVEKELEQVTEKAEKKAEAVEKAVADSIKRQQLLFDKTKLEVSAFKAEITKIYKQHLELLQELPNEVPMDPEHIAEVVSARFDKAPEAEEFVESDIKTENSKNVLDEIFSVAESDEKSSGFEINTEEGENEEF